MPESRKVFIGYVPEDIEYARRLYGDLLHSGAEPWLDRESIPPGRKWSYAIKRAIRTSDFFVPLLSSKSVSAIGIIRKGLADLLKYAIQRNIYIIPLRLDNSPVPQKELGDFGWIDMFPKWEQGLENTWRTIETHPHPMIRGVSEADSAPIYRSPEQALARGEAPSSPKPQRIEPVLFSAYYPAAIQRETPFTISAYAFRESAGKAILADAHVFAKVPHAHGIATISAARPIVIGTPITVTLSMPDFQVHPRAAEVDFESEWHRVDFTVSARAGTSLDHQSFGRLCFTMNGIALADLTFSILITQQSPKPKVKSDTVPLYPTIFCSYSHEDEAVVQRVESAVKSLGMKYLRDKTTLRSGEKWDIRLIQLIDEADIFQLFWSKFAAESRAVEKEWRHALTLEENRPSFIRPVYWYEPLVTPPSALASIHFDYRPELAT